MMQQQSKEAQQVTLSACIWEMSGSNNCSLPTTFGASLRLFSVPRDKNRCSTVNFDTTASFQILLIQHRFHQYGVIRLSVALMPLAESINKL
jgi:hypothetical protein